MMKNKTKTILILLLIGNIVSIGVALKTDKVEFGINGAYDGAVYIQRTDAGELVFKDTSITTPVVLSTLSKKSGNHSDLLGLLGDDHPQYLTLTRHQQAHDATLNDALPISADVTGNTLMGDHFQDAAIHLNRTQEEQVQGRWVFTGGVESAGEMTINSTAPEQNPLLIFNDDGNEAQIEWNGAEGKIEFSKPISAQQAGINEVSSITVKVNEMIDGSDEQGEPNAVLEKFARINGIDGDNLLDKSADEDIVGQWDFMKKVKVFQTLTDLSPLEWGLSSILTTVLQNEDAVSGLTRIGANVSSSFSSSGTGEVNNSKNVGVMSEASSTGKSESGESINNIGMVGKAYSESQNSNVIGVAGIASEYLPNRSRIGLFGGLSSEFLDNPTSIPAGIWAGYFEGNVGVNGSLLVNGKEVTLKNSNVITVGKDGADFNSIQEAIDSITDSSATKPYVVMVYPGVYEETVDIPASKSYISLVGVDRNSCQIKKNQFVGGDNVASGVIRLYASHILIKNLTIYNTHDVWGEISPAIITGNTVDDINIENCNLFSNSKDTVFLNLTNTFGSGRMWQCYVKGTYDILTVSGSIWCQDCRFEITAMSSSAVLFFHTSATCMINNCFIDMHNQSSQTSQMTAFGGGTIYYVNNTVNSGHTRQLLSSSSHDITVYAYGSAYKTVGGGTNCTVITECMGNVKTMDLNVHGNAMLGNDSTEDTHQINGDTTIKLSDTAGMGKLSVQDSNGTEIASLNSVGDLTVERDLRCEDVVSSGSVTVAGNLAVATNVLYVDTVNNRVGINRTPSATFDMYGSARISSNCSVGALLPYSGSSLAIGDGDDLVTVKDALRLYPVSSWSGTDRGTLYYNDGADDVYLYDGVAWYYLQKTAVPCPELLVFGTDYPTTKTLWYKASLLTGCIGKENEDKDEVVIDGREFCNWAFTIYEPKDTTYLKSVGLKVGDSILQPCRVVGGKRQGEYLVLEVGDKCVIEFDKEQISGKKVVLEVEGYYEIGEDATGLQKALKRLAKRSKRVARQEDVVKARTVGDEMAERGEIYWTPEGELHAKRGDGKVFRIRLEGVK